MPDKWKLEALSEVMLINELSDLNWQFPSHFLHLFIDKAFIADRVQDDNIFPIQVF